MIYIFMKISLQPKLSSRTPAQTSVHIILISYLIKLYPYLYYGEGSLACMTMPTVINKYEILT